MAVKTEQVIQAPVPIWEIADELGVAESGVIGLADRAGTKLVEDWRGRACLPAETAGRIVREERDRRLAEAADLARRQAEFANYVRDRGERRRAAIEAADAEGLALALRRQIELGQKINSGEILSEWAVGGGFQVGLAPGMQARQAGKNAGLEALRKFDREDRELGFDEWSQRKGTR